MTAKDGGVAIESQAYPKDYALCHICNKPFGTILRYPDEGGWSHWHCIMNKIAEDAAHGREGL